MYCDITSKGARDKYGELNPPIIFIDEKIFSEGYIPFLGELKQSILKSL